MPFGDIGNMQQDEEGNVTGGMESQSPVIHALMLAQAHGRLQGLADLARSTLMRRGGVGGPKGINPKAVIRSPQVTAEGTQLPSVAELYDNVPLRGQPSARGPEVTRAMNRQSMNTPQDMPIPGKPLDVTRVAQAEHNIPRFTAEQTPGSVTPHNQSAPGSALSGVRRADNQDAQTHLQALQNLLTRMFMGSSRN